MVRDCAVLHLFRGTVAEYHSGFLGGFVSSVNIIAAKFVPKARHFSFRRRRFESFDSSMRARRMDQLQ